MTSAVTVRIDGHLRRALEARARATGMTLSATVREILAHAVVEKPIASRVGHLRGRVRLSAPRTGTWRARLREHNWRK